MASCEYKEWEWHWHHVYIESGSGTGIMYKEWEWHYVHKEWEWHHENGNKGVASCRYTRNGSDIVQGHIIQCI